MQKGLPFDMCPPEESANVIKIMRSQERSVKNNGAPDKIV
jgi:antitoxin component of RelBE/YafQ-DinJ toxin-antitoxin module